MIIVKGIMNKDNKSSVQVNLIFQEVHEFLCGEVFVEPKENKKKLDGS